MKQKMASVIFGVNKKGVYQLCDDKEVLHEIVVFLGKMWNGCRSCRNCKICTDYSFLVEELGRSVLEKEKRTTSGAFTETQTNILLKWRKLSEGNYFINHVS